MFLKGIEIRGFKSFADKTELDFKKGVTAVVGPNGSGKSNISDAVRWVLGEQSVKSLRGGKMEDVIFAGTQFRKPVGLAQVMLTLDNTDGSISVDYNDVTIGRRLYRSGESEYYINNTKCRLKDVQEMFMDTGIGKEGYSIIGQGKIEAVLSGKPEERRGLLEEAAGIVKFKTRKEEAERKLENTEENLTRINDIIGTYEERIEPLRNESEKAKNFIELSSKLKENEINLLVNSAEKHKVKINHISQAIENLDVNIEKISQEKHMADEKLKKLEKDLENLEGSYEVKRKEYYGKKSEEQQLLSENKLMEEKIENSKVVVNKAKAESEEIEEKLKKLLFEKESSTIEYENLSNKLSEIIQKIESLVKLVSTLENEKKQYDENLISYKNEQFDTLGAISDVNNFITLLKKDIENHELNIEQITQSCNSYLSSIKINTTTKIALEKQMESIKEKICTYDTYIKTNKKEMSNLNRILSSNETKVKEFNAQLNKFEANRHMLQSLEAQYEGYNRSVKNLMLNIKKGQINGAEGKSFVLGEIIDVKKGLEVAIEIALGGAISNIITEDEILAKRLINYLKQNNLGRATFLPLNILKNKKLILNKDIIETSGFVGIGSELLVYDKKFTTAIEHILGRVVIAKDMDSALEIAKKGNFTFKIVTISGEVVNAGGALSGGSIYNKSLNIIGRKREIEDLKNKIEKIEFEISELSTKNKADMESIRLIDEKNLNFMDSIHSENIEITKIQGRISAIEVESEKLNNSYNISNKEISVLNGKFSEASKDLIEEEKKLETLKQKEVQLASVIEEMDKTLKLKNNEGIDFNSELTSVKIEKAKHEEILTAKIREMKRIEAELEDINIKKNKLVEEITFEHTNTENFLLKLKDNEMKINDIKEFISEMDKIFESREIEKIQLKNELKVYNEKLEEINLTLKNTEEVKHRHELSLTKIETEEEALISKINTEYKLTYAEALEYKNDSVDMNEVKNIIEDIKRKISTLGNVNVGAVQEYKEVSEKYEFMTSQRDDLVKAKEEILNIISDMLFTMRKVFAENFSKIRENFNETFAELFKGGSADLILSGDDVLSANIEINVEPPGKKLQNINLMSGGEKGLSAIALLFAILKMKPTPFCILDEIEAALDDANVSRYSEFLKKFSENIQFIVITHRKGTMEACDVLYGVTMEEKGVSKIVSVDLTTEAV
jgi:chromosome segregation protein